MDMIFKREKFAPWTNAAYPAVGLYAAYLWPVWPSFTFAVVMIYMGLTSWGFHWFTERNRKKKWQRLDEGAMYISLWFLFVAFLVAGVVPPWLMAGIGIAVGIFMAINWRRFGSFQAVFCLFMALAVLALYFTGNEALWPLGTFAVAFAVRQVGEHLAFWWKDLTHGIWHVLTAFGFFQYFELSIMVFLNAFR